MKNIEGVKLQKFTYQVLKSFKQDYTDLENYQDSELVLEDTIELDCSGYHNPLEVFWAWRIREARIYNKKLSEQDKTLFSYIVVGEDSLKGEEE
ncbi:hypothetical protein [uncultured Mediterranean phage uvMED]|nr:hypothetical protein [uncultured Mediterranean phage uvMED]